jgi:putative ATPase
MVPLAERIRPGNLDEVLGQEHLTGPGKPLRNWVNQKRLPSLLFWGPPGAGKTTLARILARQSGLPFETLSAVSAGVREVRECIQRARAEGSRVLFIDEIHRFSKSQQDALLGAVESGEIVLIGATTENPSFEVNRALLSRCQVMILQEHTAVSLDRLLGMALEKDVLLAGMALEIREKEALFLHSGGDGRRMLNLLEMVVEGFQPGVPRVVDNAAVEAVVQRRTAAYDKDGEQHYDIVSAFIKSLRGSDADAALYWCARMLQGGEDILFIARRMVVFAAEDIGLANPNSLLLAHTCFEACHRIGMPEARIILSEVVCYLARSPKNNASYMAMEKALELAAGYPDLPVPLHLRNAPTRLMKELQYGNGYKYPHDFPGNYVEQQYLPDALAGTRILDPARLPEKK